MILVKQIFINKKHKDFKECDRIAYLSKNLYNAALYTIKNHYNLTGDYLNYFDINRMYIKENNKDYRNLPTKVSNQTLMLLDRNFKSYFAALKSYKRNPNKFTGIPLPPKFKDSKKGRFTTVYEKNAISKTSFKKGVIKLSKTTLEFKTDLKTINQVTITPYKEGYMLNMVYEKVIPEPIINSNFAGLDIGLNNLASVLTNNCDSFIINGKPLKSINQYYNKKLSVLKSKLPKRLCDDGETRQLKTSNAIKRLTTKRNNKIKTYIHRASRLVVDKLVELNVSLLVIGHNKGWKDSINLGKRTNANFVSIPHSQLIQKIEYKCQLVGITTIVREESYTSKCSFLDNEKIGKHKTYLGKRIKRGLFRSSNGTIINADSQAAGNILRKEVPNAFNKAKGIEGITVFPTKYTPVY